MSTNDPTKTMWNQQQELYLKYKSKTERVLSWLKTTTNMKPGAPISSKYQYNINDFIDSAKALRRNGLKAPEYIYWDLEDAIKGRNEVSIFYHTQVIKTTQQKITTHVFFTDGLKTIRDSLFPNPPKTTRPAPKAPDRHLRSSGVENMFTTLSIEDPSETDIGEVSSPKAVSQIMGTPSKVTKEEAPHDITVEGDDMDKFYELAEWMSKVEYLIEEGIEVWKRARLGANSVPLALLGWLSYVLDAAIAASITELIALLAQPYSSIDPQHHETINKFPVGHDLHGQTGNHSGIVKAVFDFKNEYLGKNGMVDPIVLSDKTGSAMSINLVPLDVEILWRDWTFPKPFDYMEDSPSDYESNREKLYFGKISPFVECMLAGLQRFKQDRPFPQYLGKDWHINALCFNIGSRPLLSIASDASTLDPIDFRRSMMALSMTMLLQLKAYQVFYHCVSFDGSRNGMSPPSNTCDSRFKSFVKEFAVSLETVYTHNMIKECENLPDECFAMMKNSHKQILDEANAYPLATAWYFDLYAMAPMTAAVQIMALRQLSIKMAGDLCDEKGMFGAVLHLYNAMVSSGRMPQMQLLEFVCDVLFDQVFMGKRDTTNKTSSFRRFLGADQYDDAAKDTRHKKGYRPIWRLRDPHHLPCSQHNGRIDLTKICNTDYIMWHAQGDFSRLDISKVPNKTDLTDAMLKGMKADWITCTEKHRAVLPMTPDSFVDLCDAIEKEFDPAGNAIARINWFEVLKTCLTIFQRLAENAKEVINDLQDDNVEPIDASLIEIGIVFIDTAIGVMENRYPNFGARHPGEQAKFFQDIRDAFIVVPQANSIQLHQWREL